MPQRSTTATQSAHSMREARMARKKIALVGAGNIGGTLAHLIGL